MIGNWNRLPSEQHGGCMQRTLLSKWPWHTVWNKASPGIEDETVLVSCCVTFSILKTKVVRDSVVLVTEMLLSG